MKKMIKKIISKITDKLRLKPSWQKKLDSLRKQKNKKERNNSIKKIRILVGPTFSIWEPSLILERVMAEALYERNCEIIPMYCDSVQKIACSSIGGEWGEDKIFEKECNKCKFKSERIWEHLGDGVIKFSSYLQKNKKEDELSKKIDGFDLENLINFADDDINFGHLAKDIINNQFLVGNIELVPNAKFLLKSHIINLITIKEIYIKIIEKYKPDRVISNDSYYGMWNILEVICKKNSIPYYSYWPVTKDRIVVACNDASMNINMINSWPKFSKIPLMKIEEERIELWLKGKRGLIIDTIKLNEKNKNKIEEIKLDVTKPTILLAANVVWDLAALNKQIIFKDMMSWIIETIEFFTINNEYQLIIKPHPAESAKGIPKTKETVLSAILKKNIKIPPNVHMLNSNSKVSVNKIKELFDIRGVVVHTTTVGFEFPAYGIPAITTARAPYRGFGFTIDPKNKKEYFDEILTLVSSEKKKISNRYINLAKKFIKFYQFHYFIKLNIFDNIPVELSTNFSEKINEKNSPLDYICESIIKGKPINSDQEWIGES
jgi:hypothetical protein